MPTAKRKIHCPSDKTDKPREGGHDEAAFLKDRAMLRLIGINEARLSCIFVSSVVQITEVVWYW